MTNFKRVLPLFIAGAVFVAGASTASASVPFGNVLTPAAANCDSGYVYTGAPATHSVPISGVITSWSVNRPSTGQVNLKVIRTTGATRLVTGSSGLETTTVPGLSTFAARIPATAGDRLGLWHNGDQFCRVGASGESIEGSNNPFGVDPGTGTSYAPFGAIINNGRLVVAAAVEPDANGDGFGDETQQCRVPAVKRLTANGAKAALTKAGCKFGKVKKKKLKKFTKKSRKNRVRTQSVAAGSVKPIGTVVDITINAKKKAKKK